MLRLCFRVFTPLFYLFPQKTPTNNVTINIILVQYLFLLQFRETKYKYKNKYSLFNGFAYSTVCEVLALFFWGSKEKYVCWATSKLPVHFMLNYRQGIYFSTLLSLSSISRF